MSAYRIPQRAGLWQLASPPDGNCIGGCEELSFLVPSACLRAQRRGDDVHLIGDAEHLDGVFFTTRPIEMRETVKEPPSAQVKET